jgi:hypothetical protein
MILASIYYQVFPGEAEALEADAERDWHQIEGELRLEFTDGPAQFVSWGNGPVQYAVEVREDSFFDEHLLASVEMSDHPYWSNLIGHELSLDYADPDHQVLRVVSAAGEVFLSSQYADGTFQGDSLRIAPRAPH